MGVKRPYLPQSGHTTGNDLAWVGIYAWWLWDPHCPTAYTHSMWAPAMARAKLDAWPSVAPNSAGFAKDWKNLPCKRVLPIHQERLDIRTPPGSSWNAAPGSLKIGRSRNSY